MFISPATYTKRGGFRRKIQDRPRFSASMSFDNSYTVFEYQPRCSGRTNSETLERDFSLTSNQANEQVIV